MRNRSPLIITLSIIGLMFIFSACNIPLSQQVTTPETSSTGEVISSATGIPDLSTQEAQQADLTSTPTALPTPVLPSGWVEHVGKALGLTFYHPADWQLIPYDEYKLDLRESDGDGWVEISIVDETNAYEWGLDYTPGKRAEVLLNILLGAAREDGEFEDARPLLTRGGRTAWVSQGVYAILNDTVLIGILGLPERAIIILGHGGQEPEDWGTRLLPLYETLVWSIEPL